MIGDQSIVVDDTNKKWRKNRKSIKQVLIEYNDKLIMYNTHATGRCIDFINITLLYEKCIPICFVGNEADGLGDSMANTLCFAYSSMLEFEKEHPEIAKEYFDMRYDEQEYAIKKRNYVRRCENCPFEWKKVMCGEVPIDKALQLFFLNRIDLDCVKCYEPKCILSPEVLGDFWVNIILNTQGYKLLNLIEKSEIKREDITPANISQFSNFDEVDNVIRILADSGIENLDWKIIGYFLDGKGKTEGAKQKYGENHYKLSMQLGLASISNNYKISVLGEAYRRLPDDRSKKELKSKLILRVPIIQEALIRASNESVNITEEMSRYLSPSTVKRRKSNIRKLLNIMTELNSAEINTRIGYISWGG